MSRSAPFFLTPFPSCQAPHGIAARRIAQRKVPQVAFKPDWTRHAKAAPFKRNDAMLCVLPIGVMVFPGTGILDNLADKARGWAFRFGNSATAARECRRLHAIAVASVSLDGNCCSELFR